MCVIKKLTKYCLEEYSSMVNSMTGILICFRYNSEKFRFAHVSSLCVFDKNFN